MPAAGFADVRAARIARFLDEIGIPVEPTDLTADTFLPGIEVRHGRLLVDESKLTWPGDLLHEAGHVAVAPPELRDRIGGEIDLPGIDMAELEYGAVAWSYAAARHVGIDPAEVFHEGGYRGRSTGILATYGMGVYPGVGQLVAAGMTLDRAAAAAQGVPPYPHMVRWLREAG